MESAKRERVKVDSGSLIYADRNMCSVPSRLIGEIVSSNAIARQKQEPALSMSDRGGLHRSRQALMKISDPPPQPAPARSLFSGYELTFYKVTTLTLY
jgi:hypothetical protein